MFLLNDVKLMRFFSAALHRNHESIFRYAGVLTLHNILIPVAQSVLLESKARGTYMTVDHTVWVQTCLPFFVFPFHLLSQKTHAHTHTHSHVEAPKG